MLGRVSGMCRDVVMAFAFGTDSAVAALLMAYRLAHLLRRLFGEGALQSAFIPQFEELRQDNPDRAFSLFRDLSASLALFLTFLIIVGMGVGAFFFSANQQVIPLVVILLPSLLFICLYGLNIALMQCEGRYFVGSAAPVGFNILWISGALLLSHLNPTDAMPTLALFIVAGCAAQWAITLPGVRRILSRSPSCGIRLFSPDLKRIAKPLTLGIIGVGATQINSALDVLFARYADVEGPALLWYAIRLQQLPLALFGIALAGALLPPLSRAIKAGDWENARQFFRFAVGKNLLLMVPITLFLWFFGEFVVGLVYGRGHFGAESIAGTTRCLWGYALALVPMTLNLIIAPVFYAQNNYRVPTQAATLSMGLNIVLNTIFIVGLGWGTASVALATGVSSWVQCAFLLVMLRRSASPIL